MMDDVKNNINAYLKIFAGKKLYTHNGEDQPEDKTHQ